LAKRAATTLRINSGGSKLITSLTKSVKFKAEGEKLKTLEAIKKRKRAGVQLMSAHDKYAQAKACLELCIAKMNFEKIQSKLVRESGWSNDHSKKSEK
jgi:hypothetical protein